MSPNPQKKKVLEFVALAASYKPQLLAFLSRRMYSARDQELDDLAQKTYQRLLQMNESTEVQKPLAYLYTVASHVLEESRVASARDNSRVTVDTDAMEQWADHAESLFVGEPGERLNLQQQLDRALSEVPPMQKAVVLLHYRDGFSHQEIAAELKLSRKQVHKYIMRAKAHFRKRNWER